MNQNLLIVNEKIIWSEFKNSSKPHKFNHNNHFSTVSINAIFDIFDKRFWNSIVSVNWEQYFSVVIYFNIISQYFNKMLWRNPWTRWTLLVLCATSMILSNICIYWMQLQPLGVRWININVKGFFLLISTLKWL